MARKRVEIVATGRGTRSEQNNDSPYKASPGRMGGAFLRARRFGEKVKASMSRSRSTQASPTLWRKSGIPQDMIDAL